jgi:hypothetical protein
VGSIPEAEPVVVVHAVAAGPPALALESLEWNHDAAIRVGETVRVSTSWRVLQPLDADFAATVQLLDASGERVAGADLGPGAGMPETSTLVPDQIIDVTFDLSIPATLQPGEYQLLAALYAPQGDFPRQQILLPDGRVAQQMTVAGLVVQP